jgi:hypothetical protein
MHFVRRPQSTRQPEDTALLTSRSLSGIVATSVAYCVTGAVLSAQAVIEYDQQAKAFKELVPGNGEAYLQQLNATTFRLKRPATVQVRVVRTNTAYFSVTTDTGIVTVQRAPDLSAFLAAARPYFPQIATAMAVAKTNGKGGPTTASTLPSRVPSGGTERQQLALERAHDVEDDLIKGDSLVHGPRGKIAIHDGLVAALDRMRPMQPDSIEAAANEYRKALGLIGGTCGDSTANAPLGVASGLVEVARRLRPHHDSLVYYLADPEWQSARDSEIVALRRKLAVIAAAADSLLNDADRNVSDAYHVEAIALTTATACSHWESKSKIAITHASTRALGLKISTRPDPEIVRLPITAPAPPTLTVVGPRAFFDPTVGLSVGLSVLAAPQARSFTYGTRVPATGGTSVEIYEVQPVDQRFSWGGTLGVNLRPLDWRDGDGRGFAIWLPELTVGQPSTEFGFGCGVSWGPLKLGGGTLFVQHQSLDGQQLGDKIPNAGFLQQRPTFGRGVPYVSLSVFGNPLFALGK